MTATFSRRSPPLLTDGQTGAEPPTGLAPIDGDHGGRREGDRQHDDVALVALHAHKVPDDQPAFTVILQKPLDALITRLFETPSVVWMPGYLALICRIASIVSINACC